MNNIDIIRKITENDTRRFKNSENINLCYFAIRVDNVIALELIMKILTSLNTVQFLQLSVKLARLKTLTLLLKVDEVNEDLFTELFQIGTEGGSLDVLDILLNSVQCDLLKVKCWTLACKEGIKLRKNSTVEFLLNFALHNSLDVAKFYDSLWKGTLQTWNFITLYKIIEFAPSITSKSTSLLASEVIDFISIVFMSDFDVEYECQFQHHMREKESRSFLSLIKGLFRYNPVVSQDTGRNLLLMATYFNLIASYDFICEKGASVGSDLHPVVSILVRIWKIADANLFPSHTLLKRITDHPTIYEKLFSFNEGEILKSMVLFGSSFVFELPIFAIAVERSFLSSTLNLFELFTSTPHHNTLDMINSLGKESQTKSVINLMRLIQRGSTSLSSDVKENITKIFNARVKKDIEEGQGEHLLLSAIECGCLESVKRVTACLKEIHPQQDSPTHKNPQNLSGRSGGEMIRNCLILYLKSNSNYDNHFAVINFVLHQIFNNDLLNSSSAFDAELILDVALSHSSNSKQHDIELFEIIASFLLTRNCFGNKEQMLKILSRTLRWHERLVDQEYEKDSHSEILTTCLDLKLALLKSLVF